MSFLVFNEMIYVLRKSISILPALEISKSERAGELELAKVIADKVGGQFANQGSSP